MAKFIQLFCLLMLFIAASFADEIPLREKIPSREECVEVDAGVFRIVVARIAEGIKVYFKEDSKAVKDVTKVREFAQSVGDIIKAQNPAAGPAVDRVVTMVKVTEVSAKTVDVVSKRVVNELYAIRNEHIKGQNEYALDKRAAANWKDLHAKLLPGKPIPDLEVSKPPGGICLGGEQTYKENSSLDAEIDRLEREATESEENSVRGRLPR